MKIFKTLSRKCGDFLWGDGWFVRQNSKPPRYYCENCDTTFRTGKFSKSDSEIYDDICPNCGAPGIDFEELILMHRKEIGRDKLPTPLVEPDEALLQKKGRAKLIPLDVWRTILAIIGLIVFFAVVFGVCAIINQTVYGDWRCTYKTCVEVIPRNGGDNE